MPTVALKMSSVRITSRYGPRILNGRTNVHKGVDFAFGSGVAVSSWGDGIVVESAKHYEYGYYVRVSHASGIVTSYHSLLAKGKPVGTVVNMGETIGFAGKSALGATGPHLHAGLWINGNHVDPLKYLKQGQVVYLTLNGGALSTGNSAPFDNSPKPTPKPDAEEEAPIKEKEQDLDMAGTLYRISTGQGSGGIYWQDAPNEPLLPLDYTQYEAYAHQGYKFIEGKDAMTIQALQRRVGVYELDAKYGRKIVAKDGEYSHKGFKVWLPG